MSEKAKGSQIDISGTPLPSVLNTMQQDIDTKASSSYVDTELAKKSDTEYVNTQLLLKADSSAVALALATKADASALAGLASETYVNNAVSSKADASALVGLASETYVDNAVSTKADSTAVANALDTKADASAVSSALEDKADASALSALDSTVVKKAELKQTTGGSEDTPMSQKAVTQAIAAGVGENIVREAPEDGKQYARKDGYWEEVVASGEGVQILGMEFWEEITSAEVGDTETELPILFEINPGIYSILNTEELYTNLGAVAEELTSKVITFTLFGDESHRFTIFIDSGVVVDVISEEIVPYLPHLSKSQVEDDQDDTFGLVSGERLAQAIAKHGGGGGGDSSVVFSRIPYDAFWEEVGDASEGDTATECPNIFAIEAGKIYKFMDDFSLCTGMKFENYEGGGYDLILIEMVLDFSVYRVASISIDPVSQEILSVYTDFNRFIPKPAPSDGKTYGIRNGDWEEVGGEPSLPAQRLTDILTAQVDDAAWWMVYDMPEGRSQIVDGEDTYFVVRRSASPYVTIDYEMFNDTGLTKGKIVRHSNKITKVTHQLYPTT